MVFGVPKNVLGTRRCYLYQQQEQPDDLVKKYARSPAITSTAMPMVMNSHFFCINPSKLGKHRRFELKVRRGLL